MIPAAIADIVALPRTPDSHAGYGNIDGADQGHPVLSVSVRRPGPPSTGQRYRPLAERGVDRSMSAVLITPLPSARRLSVSTRAGVPPRCGAGRRPRAVGRSASRPVLRRRCARGATADVPGLPSTPAHERSQDRSYIGAQAVGTNKSGRCAAQRRTRAMSRRIRGMSRCALTSPASHKRVRTIIARAIHTMPPCVLTRISSACTCPGSVVARPNTLGPPVPAGLRVPTNPLRSARRA